MMPYKTLFAGPWVGELGWELFCWSGYLRRMAVNYGRVVIACRTGHDLLYRDFADEIIHYDPQIEETDMWKNHREPDHRGFHLYYTEHIQALTVVHNNRFPARWWDGEHWSKQQEFTPFGVEGGNGYDVLLCIRNTSKCNTAFRNWPIEHAIEVAEQLTLRGLSVACIGRSGSALCVPGVDDQRDIPLDELAQMMVASRVIVGPQCGPLHLATLCRLPQVSWQTCSEHAVRMQQHWNPFHTPVATIPGKDAHWRKRKIWLPPVTTILGETLTMIRKGI